MKKITIFTHGLYRMGGIERIVSILANELCNTYQVEIISLHKDNEQLFYELDSRVKVISILGKDLQPIKLYYPYLMYKTKKALKNYKTDVFICAGIGDVGLTIFMHKKAKYVAWEHLTTATGNVRWSDVAWKKTS